LLKGLDDRRPCADLALDMEARNDDIRGVRTVLVLESAANLGAEDLAEPPGYFPFPVVALASGSAAAHSSVSCFPFVEAIMISSCSLASRIRRSAMAWYFGSRSHPMNARPRRLHATPVVPLPEKGSRTISPGSVKSRTSASISQRGFWVGCSRLMPPPFEGPVQTAGRPPPFHFMRPETRGTWPMMTHSAPAAGRSPVI